MKRERGAALLLFFMLLFVAGAALWLTRAASATHQHAAATTRQLARARELILAHVTTAPAVDPLHQVRPGWLPFPDRGTGHLYDGNGDCYLAAGSNGVYYVGRWPFRKDQGCVVPAANSPAAFAEEVGSGDGDRLWYALSPNLAWPHHPINTDMSGDWLSVVDYSGRVVAAEVAVILFSAGVAATPQTRDGAAPTIDQFLDSYPGIAGGNADGDLQFVIAPANLHFNDRLSYITRSEYMGAVADFVAREIKHALEAAYPAGAYGALPVTLPAWFASDWVSITSYTPGVTAQLRFAGCSIVYTLRHDLARPIKSARVC